MCIWILLPCKVSDEEFSKFLIFFFSCLTAPSFLGPNPQVFDVLTYDMMYMIRLAFTPSGAVTWCFKKDDAKARVAIADKVRLPPLSSCPRLLSASMRSCVQIVYWPPC